jgi:hypothetical protein
MTKEIMHFGILGMKWGIRRKNPSGPSSADKLTSDAIRKKKINELSNKDLETAIKRMQLEKQYKDLDKKTLSDGQKIWRDAYNEVAKSQVKAFLAGGAAVLVKNVVENFVKDGGVAKAKDVVDSYFVK